MYPQLTPPQPQLLTQSELKTLWLDRLLGMSGIKRKR
jgi:hypothetical protein